MAEVADLFFHPLDGDDDVSFALEMAGAYDYGDGDEEFRETLDSVSPFFWSFSVAGASDDDGGSVTGDLLETLESRELRLFEDADETGSDYVGLDAAFDVYNDVVDERPDDDLEAFLIQGSATEEDAAGNSLPGGGEGLRIVGLESESDLEEEGVDGVVGHELYPPSGDEGDDLGPPLPWESLRIGEEEEDSRVEEVVMEEFEWEEVDERVTIRMLVRADEEEDHHGLISETIEELDVIEDVGLRQSTGALDWEVLLGTRGISDADAGGDGGPGILIETEDAEAFMEEDLANAAEYEVLFGQFLEHVSPLNGSPPAARTIVESLPSVSITVEDVANNNTLCAVCKDDISLEEKVKQLPCTHYYHENCILPWLRLRNTCPVCRYELPTDNPEYENWRARRTGGASDTSMD